MINQMLNTHVYVIVIFNDQKSAQLQITIKGAQPNCFRFFPKPSEILVPKCNCFQKKDHTFLITPSEFYIWKMYCLEDINI